MNKQKIEKAQDQEPLVEIMKAKISYVIVSGASEILVTWITLKGMCLEPIHSAPSGIWNREGVADAGQSSAHQDKRLGVF